MFFYLSKLTTFLMDPVFLLLLFTLLSWLVSKKRYQQKLKSIVIILVFYALSTELIANSLFSILESRETPTQLAEHYDSVTVLSGMSRSGKSPSSDTIEFTDAVDRILMGMDILKSGKADYLIISGGDGSLTQSNQSEAIALKYFAIKWGIDSQRIIIDAVSRNTYENAVNTTKIFKEYSFKKNLMITSAFHMPRARGCFRKTGEAVDILPVDFRVAQDTLDFRTYLPSAAALKLSGDFIHEVIGITVYGVTGKADYFE